MRTLPAREPFDPDRAAERYVLRLAWLVYKGCALEYDAEAARLIAPDRKRSVVRVVSRRAALDAEAVLHAFDPNYYPPPRRAVAA